MATRTAATRTASAQELLENENEDAHEQRQPEPEDAAGMEPRSVRYSRFESMLAQGPQGLHRDLAAKVEAALGRAFPQMEVRFHHLSLSAELVTAHEHTQQGDGSDDDDEDCRAPVARTPPAQSKPRATGDELPTLPNHVLQSLAKVAKKKHVVRKHILKDVSGVFRPGTVTLVLGQSGSGKSALMKLLSGRFPMDPQISLSGDVSFNGMARAEIVHRLPQLLAYVTQTDTHFPTLTVRETLEFAHTCCGATLSKRAEELLSSGTPEENAAAIKAARAIFEHYPDIVIQELGLENCQHTVVGNALVRGVSGGERKRLTTGEMEFGLKYVTLMDEITTGLDSAAAFDIINTQRSIAQRLHKTVVISLLQPSPEIFELFDYVLLLNDGEVLYHGPRHAVREYFEQLGFICPPRRDIADFLCDLGTPQQRQYEYGPLPPQLQRHPRRPSEFAEQFRASEIYRSLEAELTSPVCPELLMDAERHMAPIPEFHQSFWASTWTQVRRQLLLLSRNKPFLFGRAMLVLIMGALFSSVFYQIDLNNAQVVLGVLFASVLFLGLGQASMLTTFFHARAVFYKQRGANFYRTSSYVLASSISQLPMAIAESLTFGSMVYWFGGFVKRAPEFILFEVFLLLSILVFLAWFFFLAAVAPDLHIAKPLAMVSLLAFILFAGFVVTKDHIPDYMSWLYWIDPVAWAMRSLAVSQYRSKELDVCEKDGVQYCTPAFGNKTMGRYLLSLFDVPDDKAWVWLGVVFMGGAYLLFMVLAWLVLEYKRYEKPEHIALPNDLDGADGSVLAMTDDDDDSTKYQSLATPKGDAMAKAPQDNAHVVLDVDPQRSTAKSFSPVTVAFKDLWYTVPVPGDEKNSIDLLKGITGYAMPGTITALMGSSGAGKTTLMDVIAGRKTGGKIRGQILLNGAEASDLAIRRCTGYCEQMDIHSEASTFREALTFSAFLRQSSRVSDAHKYDTVEECLDLLGMQDIADHIIRGSSMEQHKRLTIGVELAAQPSVLFLDEPTSGLDARSAKVIMEGVRKVADTGRTILCTIHQPSTEVFHLFDRLLLLKRGGEAVFFGPLGHQSQTMIDYFEAMPGVHKIKDGYNPATWMLEVIGAGVAGADKSQQAVTTEEVDFVDLYKQSSIKAEFLDAKMQEPGLFTPRDHEQPVTFAEKRAATDWLQFRMIMQRFFTVYWRTPSYNLTRLIISLFLGLLFGLLYVDSTYTTYQGINGGMGMIFLATAFIGIVSFISVLPLAFEERAAFYRERASQTYNSLWYFFAFTIVEIPYVCVGSLLFTAVFYPMVGFQGWANAAFYWFNTVLHILFQTYMGQFLIFAFPSIEVAAVVGMLCNAICIEVAAVVGMLCNAIWFLFMGFNPPALEIPHGYKWLYNITPQRYSFALLAGIVFGECSDSHLAQMARAQALRQPLDTSDWPLGCQVITNAPPSIGKAPIKLYIQKVFGIKHDHLGEYLGIMVAMIVVFRILAAFTMRYVNHQKR
ncbi:hypothetical protein P43SY_006770 [Pythium insidiosum]|uniref:ABC transporter domain-containing protein n=1 Tax=Pythium insidiosum TaxID=114742 RepID=A0AAD5QF10_PYTIN|nr:hypothetical protein P43SY_006770 [Pythium insidiosum]